MHSLSPILEPRSVAVVGASGDPAKRGHQVVAALRASGFPGAILPVNPKGGTLLGLEVAPSIEALAGAPGGPPDLAYVATPAATVPGVVEALGRAGVRGAVVPAVGFRESGPDGAALERRLVDAARATGIRVIGPNTSGVLNTHARLHLVGGEPLAPGGLAILSQSGNIALDLMTAASARPLGVSIYVGPGNEADLGFHEILDFLGGHEPTRAIAMYVEGVREGRAFYETARRVAEQKPIVVLKGGRSGEGGRAARSHTGALAGSHAVFRAVARQAGLVEVDRSDELLPVAEALALRPGPRPGSRGVVIVSDGGGHATLAADRFSAWGVPLADLSEATRRALAGLLGPAASVVNPVDVAGAADRAPRVLARAIEIAASDPACGALLVTGLFGGYAIRFATGLAGEEVETALAIADASRGLPIALHSLYAPRHPPALERALDLGIPVHGSLELAIRAVVALAGRDGGWRIDAPRAGEDHAPLPAARASAPDGWLSELEARRLLEPFGVSLVEAAFCADEPSLGRLPDDDVPRVLKAVSRRLPHKTEAGAVAVGVRGAAALAEAYRTCTSSAAAWLTDRGEPPEIEGVLVSPLLPEPVAELLVGVRRDEVFGPILTIGIGGVAVELMGDVSIRVLPPPASEAAPEPGAGSGPDAAPRPRVEASWVADMCRELRMGPLLSGHRGRPRADLAAVAAVANGLALALEAHPEVAEIELNPVFVYSDRAVAVDVAARRSESPAPLA